MILNNLFYIKEGFDYLSHENYAFFDIDCTLSSAIDEQLSFPTDESCLEYADKLGFKQSEFKLFTPFDLAVPQKSSLDIFGYMLDKTNTKAISISSWGSIKNGEVFIDELQRLFALISNRFPDDWLVGQSDGCGGDRWKHYVEPFTRFHPTCKHVAFDDGAHEYSNTETTIHVDSMLGLNVYDVMRGAKILGITEKPETDDLSLFYHLKKV